ncbi:hypothetical protein ACRTD6_02400 [Vibrio parahaemolyticus]|nr:MULTISPECIES: hypothetical protein [Vibrio]BDP34780.1 hypothetical protein VA208B3_11510 [Vibrio alginolyticus]EJE8517277.1 hypothetical protein [Vibrio parahaemolyticus]MBE4074193.1 hypothetical protein [Vibrio parahaemolyticus]MBE4382404.1 hypothetical protein [Vibrio parahaemolyticus]MCI9698168.1 hypothetical protein [Vibrio parahaemolyticus]
MLDNNQINNLLTKLLTEYFKTEFTYRPELDGRNRLFESYENIIILPASFGLYSPTEKQLGDRVIKWLNKANVQAGFKYQIDQGGVCVQLSPLIDYSPQDK